MKRSIPQFAALFEVLSVTVLGLALALLLPGLMGWRVDHPLVALQAVPDSWLPAAWAMTRILLLQYSGQLALAALFLLARRELSRRRLGLVSHGRAPGDSPLALAGWALLLACVLFPLSRGLLEIGLQWDLAPEMPPWRQVLLEAPFSLDFMVFMGVTSYGLVPVLEELFYRGYVQGRLQQVMSPGMAILIPAALFTLLHGQYHGAGVYHIATIATLFAVAVMLGTLYQRTGSLLPPILLHAVINLPMGNSVLVAVLAACAVGIVVFRRRLAAAFHELLAPIRLGPLRTPEWAMLGVTAALVLLIQVHQLAALALATLMLLAAVAMYLRQRTDQAKPDYP